VTVGPITKFFPFVFPPGPYDSHARRAFLIRPYDRKIGFYFCHRRPRVTELYFCFYKRRVHIATGVVRCPPVASTRNTRVNGATDYEKNAFFSRPLHNNNNYNNIITTCTRRREWWRYRISIVYFQRTRADLRPPAASGVRYFPLARLKGVRRIRVSGALTIFLAPPP